MIQGIDAYDQYWHVCILGGSRFYVCLPLTWIGPLKQGTTTIVLIHLFYGIVEWCK